MEVAVVTSRNSETRERSLKQLWALVKMFFAGKENDVAWETSTGRLVATQLWGPLQAHPHDAIALYHQRLPVAAR
jgi:hypothetical protein